MLLHCSARSSPSTSAAGAPSPISGTHSWPTTTNYKGVLQLLFDGEGVLIGFRVYWPNGTCGEYARTSDACTGFNLSFDPDGSISFMVGLIASRRGAFSPLVEHDAEPVYAAVPGTCLTPHWPSDLKPYKLG